MVDIGKIARLLDVFNNTLIAIFLSDRVTSINQEVAFLYRLLVMESCDFFLGAVGTSCFVFCPSSLCYRYRAVITQVGRYLGSLRAWSRD
jgi:hypothetical protein